MPAIDTGAIEDGDLAQAARDKASASAVTVEIIFIRYLLQHFLFHAYTITCARLLLFDPY